MTTADPVVKLLTTGGTIASRRDATGALMPADTEADIAALLHEAPPVPQARVEAREVLRGASFAFHLADLAAIAAAAREAALEPEVAGVVITHGTDIIEETAMLLDLTAPPDAPIVLTGAQAPADAPDRDGPPNLRDAVAVACDPRARGRGPLVVFDGLILPARGTRKVHTLARRAFFAPDAGPLGFVHDGEITWFGSPEPRTWPALPLTPALGEVKVDIVASYPGAHGDLISAAAATASGIVLEATGAGNATREVTAAVGEAVARGVVVAVASRTGAGPVAAMYGNGGGVDLARAGAIPAGHLAPSQARMVLAATLACHCPIDEIAGRLLTR